jgi:transposase
MNRDQPLRGSGTIHQLLRNRSVRNHDDSLLFIIQVVLWNISTSRYDMAQRKQPMRRIREVLRLADMDKLSERQIARATNMNKSTVHDYLRRAAMTRITWKAAQTLNDQTLDRLFFPSSELQEKGKIVPDWHYIHKELKNKKKHITLQLLWEEYCEENENTYAYSWFCAHYHKFSDTLDLSMRQTHKCGEKLFVDYCGDTIDVIDANTGEVRIAQIFVAVLGASNYTYAEATWTQGMCDWIGSHNRALQYIGGVPEVIVPDNLKSGVTKASYYDPEINPTYQRWAEHNGSFVIPARVRHPKDKPKVETGVLIVERWIIACLRHQDFFSLAEVNLAIARLLERLNTRTFRKMAGNRLTHFLELDKPFLHQLPQQKFVEEDWKNAKVNIDYHIVYPP